MNARLMDEVDFETLRIRQLQADHEDAHRAMLNWGRWAGDRRGVFPGSNPKCSLGPFFKPQAGEVYGEGDVNARPEKVTPLEPFRGQPRERIPYDAKAAVILDERLCGGLISLEVMWAIRTAYVSREIPENQFYALSNCSTPDQFLERLGTALRYVRRFL